MGVIVIKKGRVIREGIIYRIFFFSVYYCLVGGNTNELGASGVETNAVDEVFMVLVVYVYKIIMSRSYRKLSQILLYHFFFFF